MIDFHYETDFQLEDENRYREWINKVVASEDLLLGPVNYIFCNDEYLHRINLEYLDHDTLTDIISFDYSEGDRISGDIFISVERVVENAETFRTSFENELSRVMIHGILHYCGYKDKTEKEESEMRAKEEEKLALFHVEPKK
ncbi:rRNA maturation RNase YbeY [Robertkochia marina]|uniref:Endoribonuclease YbeY n=1 Tax=Robertkochia marina TaxID=1227945 RepID=A0A4S3M2G3_9FLAO|nr:rRNA maturation RNase YbeY [Robertkochia marina]THD69314.1 rRNA maturation RNase YbeY [Robertkochia marina]TRZ47426.1 rRNA maturation RNase YbeY [Robertkochia marina]